MNDVRKTCIIGKLPPHVGTSEWATFSRDSFCVDKTEMPNQTFQGLSGQ